VADVDQLDQVLWALLDNAVKYGERTPVDVEISPDTSAETPRIRLTIADHGPGVTETDRARLFRRFERGVDRTADDGSGLGLYVSRALMRGMGGDLVLDPAVAGRGASFRLTLPGEPADDA
jgi:signal transduction histidine kinase